MTTGKTKKILSKIAKKDKIKPIDKKKEKAICSLKKPDKSLLEKQVDWLINRLKQKKIQGSNLKIVQKETALSARINRTKALWLICYSNSTSIASACRRLGIGRRTFFDWREQDESFAEMVEEFDEAEIDWVKSKMLKRIDEGSDKLIEFYMRTKGKTRGFTEEVTSYEDDVISFTLNLGKKKLPPKK